MNIVICGVGGHGVVLAGRILAKAFIENGVPVRVGEVHGLAVRGGSVISHLRTAHDALGPIIPANAGDLMISFEPLEALRFLDRMKKNSVVVLNNRPHYGVAEWAGLAPYPPAEDILSALRKYTNVIDIDSTSIALKCGGSIYLNTVMLGAAFASGKLSITREKLLNAIKSYIPTKAVENNLIAFESGEKAVKDR
ncbi:MAG: indolepyruvate oxidoreductase subunit beta [Thermoplasmata archaeon]